MFKRSLIVLFITCFSQWLQAQSSSLMKEWKYIDSLPSKLFIAKENLSKMQLLLTQAEKEKNIPYTVKAVYAISQYYIMRDYDYKEAYNFIHQYYQKDSEPVICPLLNILELDLLTQYRSQNHYELFSSADIIPEDENDLWNLHAIDQRINQLSMSIIAERNLLSKYPSKQFEILLNKSNAPELRPTLFDIAAHKILNLLNNIAPTGAFTTDAGFMDSVGFAPYKQFIEHDFSKSTTSQVTLNYIQLYKDLLQFYSTQKNGEALAETDVLRLKFIYNISLRESKTPAYTRELQKIFDQFPKIRMAGLAGIEIAKIYYQSGITYHPVNNPEVQDHLKVALKILQEVDQYYKKTGMPEDYLNEIDFILRKQLSVAFDPNNIPEKPILVTLEYKNLSKVEYTIYQIINPTMPNLIDAEFEAYRKKHPVRMIRQKSQAIKNLNDYQSHTTEIALEPLPKGYYYISFRIDDKTTFGSFFQVTHIAVLAQQASFSVVNRENGAVIPNAEYSLWRYYYNSSQKKYVTELTTNSRTDKNGFFEYSGNNNNHRIEIKTENDHYLSLQNRNVWLSNYVPQAINTTYFFTDRILYRPGQTVHFKGIVVNKSNTLQASIANITPVNVKVRDVNNQIVYEGRFTTNEMGSFNGSFVLPANTLGGGFSLTADNFQGTHYFRVEEYKRPTFKAGFDPVTRAYQLNDQVELTGKVNAYAGYGIENATIHYTVTRRVIYPRWTYARFYYIPYENDVIITTDTTISNNKGEFSVAFQATPAPKANAKYNPVFHYEVNATITDQTGETHHTTTYLYLGWNKYQVDIPENYHIAVDRLTQFPLSITNIQGKPQKVEAVLQFEKLQSPKHPFQKKLSATPDIFTIDSVQYKQLFPHEIYGREDRPGTWKTIQELPAVSITSNEQGLIDLSKAGLTPGWYKISVQIKGENNTGTTTPVHFIQVYKDAPADIYYDLALRATYRQKYYNEKDTVDIVHNLPSGNYLFTQEYDKSRLKVTEFYDTRNTQQKVLQLAETEKTFAIAGMFNNRLYTQSYKVVPYDPKKVLDVQLETYRIKTTPGAKETWTVKVTGKDGKIIPAEIVSSLYDASLDAIMPHYWRAPYIGEGSSSFYVNWSLVDNFRQGGQQIIPFIKNREQWKLLQPYTFKGYSFYHNDYVTVSGYGAVRRQAVTANKADMAAVPMMKMEESMAEVAATSANEPQRENNAPVEPVIRSNFNETAFFFPDIKTNDSGIATLSFVLPESLTEWKWLVLAHSHELGFAQQEASIIAQKDFMVQSNLPRFVRQGDTLSLAAKLINQDSSALSGTVTVQLFNPDNNQLISELFQLKNASRPFNVQAQSTAAFSFDIVVPAGYTGSIKYVIVAATDHKTHLTDAEEYQLPVLPNEVLINGSRNIYVKGNGRYSFDFPEIAETIRSSSLQPAPLVLSFNANPSWEVIQSLPLITEVKYESSTEYAYQFYGNVLAKFIANSNPEILKTIQQWRAADSASFRSPLAYSEALKNISLSETPWLRVAQDDEATRRKIIRLFDINFIQMNIENSFSKLKTYQNADGGFSWFPGGQSSAYITQNILTVLGELLEKKVIGKNTDIEQVITNALKYSDEKMYEQYMKYKADSAFYHAPLSIQYIYMRTLYEQPAGKYREAFDTYTQKIYKSWSDVNIYNEALIGIIAAKQKNTAVSTMILNSLKDRAVISDTLGMYWKENKDGWAWYQNALVNQAILIDFFTIMNEPPQTVNSLRQWIITNKQTTQWNNNASTAKIIQAYLTNNAAWLNNAPEIQVQFAGEKFKIGSKQHTDGNIQFAWNLKNDKQLQKPLQVTVKNSVQDAPVWGSVSWQYQVPYEQLKPSQNELKISKTLLVKENNNWRRIQTGEQILVGSTVKVQLKITSDRMMEYVHIQDDRPASAEPAQQVSYYKWARSLSYYQNVKDAANHFFIEYLPAGESMIEYEWIITQQGGFGAGAATIESFYAPSFRNHTPGFRLISNTK